ncbi:MAG: 4Fe-4S binding protein [Deltaproteobacteria bacterium]|nr:4Fe-4S binding protein [Deltaproteobacteria bacterium]MBT4527089.1 4Fe-4S binding protein [Deltaproteobacteria bacterium]
MPPVYNYDLCIRCDCCQELCPDSAIELIKPLIRKVFGLFR